jgi:PAS domain S-box-containing protein
MMKEEEIPSRIKPQIPIDGVPGEIELNALKVSERQYRRLFEAAKDGILILNAVTGHIEDVNPFLIGLLGYSREEFLDRKLWEFEPFQDVAASKTAFEELKTKEFIRYEDLPLQTRNGGLVSVEFVSNVYAVNGGNVIQCNIRDITLRKQLTDELRRAKEEAEHANEAKTRFIAMLSHELRTPLNPVMMVIHAWKNEKKLPPELLPDLEIIQRNIEIQTQLIDDLLDVTAITRGKIKLEFKPHDVHELLKYAIEVVQDQIVENQLHVVMSMNAQHSMVSTDFVRLEQVLWNLTRNAVKFTPAGGTITISTVNEGSRIRIGIGDTGIGISENAMAGIFNAFEQGSQEDAHEPGGIGLGLTIAKILIELLGGSISVQSEGDGKGSRFTVTLETLQN